MSHITEVKVAINDLAALKAACDALGFEFVEGQQTYKWFGQFVGDSPLPAGVEQHELGKCSHAIRVPGATYEVGVVKAKDGTYRLRFDYWSSGQLLGPLGGQQASLLVQQYATHKVMRHLRSKGFKAVSQVKQENGSIRLAFAARGGAR